MMFSRYFNANHADMSASAPCANANTSCAYSASANNSMIAIILDAIIMASIIICALIIGLVSILGLITILAVLVLVRLAIREVHTPWRFGRSF